LLGVLGAATFLAPSYLWAGPMTAPPQSLLLVGAFVSFVAASAAFWADPKPKPTMAAEEQKATPEPDEEFQRSELMEKSTR